MSPPPAADAGSFRDRNGRVYRFGGRILRGLSETALRNFRALQDTRFYRDLRDDGAVVATEETSPPDPLPDDTSWAGWLEHRKIDFISYPYEWSFSMLRDAADLQLRVLESALAEGWTLKDATPYNVQFQAGRPIFIDLPSFEPAADTPWAGYRQFCEMFLFPLMLQAYRGIDFQPFLRAGIGGIGVQQMARLTGLRDRLRPGVFTHVWLQALLERRYAGTNRNVRSELDSAGFNRQLVMANVRRLRRLVGRLHWRAAGSEWSDYASCHNYSEADAAAKRAFVEAAIQSGTPRSVWDLGCNTGDFAAIAARHCPMVLAMDADHLAIEHLYQDEEIMGSGRVLPLVQNIVDPSPDWGWNLSERRSLVQRGQADMVLCLALLHHLVIGANIPLAEVIDWLAELAPQLVIEFVGREDDKVETLLRNRPDPCDDYQLAAFESSLARHFRMEGRLEVSDGRRVLYRCRRSDPGA